MPEKLCDDCGLPISVCNAKAMVRIAVERNGLACVGDIMPAPADLPPKVNPLVWEDVEFSNDCGHTWTEKVAKTPFGLLRIKDHNPYVSTSGFSFGFNDYYIDQDHQFYPNENAAMLAGEGEYQRRILSALDWHLTASDKTRAS